MMWHGYGNGDNLRIFKVTLCVKRITLQLHCAMITFYRPFLLINRVGCSFAALRSAVRDSLYVKIWMYLVFVLLQCLTVLSHGSISNFPDSSGRLLNETRTRGHVGSFLSFCTRFYNETLILIQRLQEGIDSV